MIASFCSQDTSLPFPMLRGFSHPCLVWDSELVHTWTVTWQIPEMWLSQCHLCMALSSPEDGFW